MDLFIDSSKKPSPIKVFINITLVVVLFVGLFWLSIYSIGYAFDFSFISDMKIRLFDGFMMTVYLSAMSLIFSLVIGFITAILQNSKILILRYISVAYVSIIRGTPLITQIYLFYYIIGTAIGLNSRFWSGVIILSLFEGAYIAEIIRGSILSIDQTQIDSAKAVGFTKKQTITKVILPQLFARTLPALTGQFASIIKDSSLLSIIAVIELTQTINEISAMNLKLFESYIFLGILYFCLTLPIGIISKKLERKFNYEN